MKWLVRDPDQTDKFKAHESVFDDPESVASEYAESISEGSENSDIIEVKKPGEKRCQRFKITVEYCPHFSAKEVKKDE